MLHSCKVATHSDPPAQLRTLGSTTSALCGQPLHASSLLQSSFAWAARRLIRVGEEGLKEGGSEGDRRAQGAEAASLIRRRPLMVPAVSIMTDHHSFAHKSRALVKDGPGGEMRKDLWRVKGVDVSCCDDIHSINYFKYIK